MLKSKKGMLTSWPDIFKGLIIGFILGAAIIYLGTKGIIPIPFL
tara:strand:- start:6461 stop:6592 length:132 start_codon:yes stop_codon:yes gene_type:complete